MAYTLAEGDLDIPSSPVTTGMQGGMRMSCNVSEEFGHPLEIFCPALPEVYCMKRYSFKRVAVPALPVKYRMKRYSFKRVGGLFPFGSSSNHHEVHGQANLVRSPEQVVADFVAWASDLE